ncbi:mannose-1-phosphate guanylyltransferase/mannose-6-phosphate isomerase [Marinovum sp.]|uniref:mannose-1-phosphate guanylyltransferase/mannose-6-phosphate isomerase n=1 Tax=Marinovum sp. TaxID=2024839 RepID=UPI003A8DF68D
MAEASAEICPVILCGGVGTRLWPLSRRHHPKQFVAFDEGPTLLQATARRMSRSDAAEAPGGGLEFAAPTMVTRSDFRFVVTQQLQDIGIDPGAVLIEPEGRNTAPAVLAAALHLAATRPEGVMLVAPSDHALPDTAAFHAAVAEGLRVVQARDDLVTFGITPDRPETGYGYLRLDAPPDASGRAARLAGFVEKPDAATAQAMLEDGCHLWNAGIFLFSVRAILAAFETHAPELLAAVRQAVAGARPDLGFLRLDEAAWAGVEDISVDYAVMERADNLSVVPFAGHWSDLGSWQAVHAEAGPDAAGLATAGAAVAIECDNTLLRAESPDQVLVGLGLSNIVAVAMPDAVVADKNRAQEVKLAVSALRERGLPQAEEFPRDHRPWGWFERLALGGRFQVKRILVNPGATLSLQSHHHRAEHWIVVEGTARVTVGEEVHLLSENQSVYVPLGVRHRMENPGKVPMVLIEVQTGGYLGEDDIVRYEDVYARG